MDKLLPLDESVQYIFDNLPLPPLAGTDSVLLRSVGKTHLEQLELSSHYRANGRGLIVTEWGEFLEEIDKWSTKQAQEVDVLLEISDLLFYRAVVEHPLHRTAPEQPIVAQHVNEGLTCAYRLARCAGIDTAPAHDVAQIKYSLRAYRRMREQEPIKNKPLERCYAQQFLETTIIPDAF